jgi:cytochrome c-type biogenesis protein CcmE
VQVRYEGQLPDLFREGQGVVCEGTWQPGQALEAERVLAKHDENYMPREVAEALKERGEWKGGDRP